ncbi:MAG TPA: methyltransferase domain-containing protein [Myxococcota bacterium]|nr:methyltransferase domain-containing protein [Myxococcota bacterium]
MSGSGAIPSCWICGSACRPFGRARILEKHDVDYFECNTCGFIETEEPYWLTEAYSSAITNSDIGLVGRNVTLARYTRNFIFALLDRDRTCLDYWGGYGLFVRLMRDYGVDFRLHEERCENLFAQGFEADLKVSSRYELLTAFEVLEHCTRPMKELERMAQLADTIAFTTELLPARRPRPGEWWYYGPEHGQHVAIFTEPTLRYVAERLGMSLHRHTRFHILTRKVLSERVLRLLRMRPVEAFLTWRYDRVSTARSLLASDYERVTGRPLA